MTQKQLTHDDEQGYYSIVQNLAAQAQKNADNSDLTVSEAVFEVVDGSELIIYNHYHTKVMDNTRQDIDMLDYETYTQGADSYRGLTQGIAFAVLHQDVSDAVQ